MPGRGFMGPRGGNVTTEKATNANTINTNIYITTINPIN